MKWYVSWTSREGSSLNNPWGRATLADAYALATQGIRPSDRKRAFVYYAAHPRKVQR